MRPFPEETLADVILTIIHLLAASTPLAVMETGALSILALGFALGLKHALDADHLVAVSTIVSGQRSLFGASIVGIFWGLGHTASLLVAGILVIAFQIQIPETVSHILELGVAVMLVGLGANVLWKLVRGGTLHVHAHIHGSHQHIHPHIHTTSDEGHTHHESSHGFFRRHLLPHLGTGKRSVLVGMVHGLAGSGALMLVVLVTIPSPWLAVWYITVFGIGSIGGLLLMSMAMGLPFAVTARRSTRLHTAIAAASGCLSVVLGLMIAWEIGIVERLFLGK